MTSEDVGRSSVEIEGTEISFETGKLARQASGAVVVRAGDTMVLCTATAGNDRDVDFLPLTVDVEEKHYAAGKIPGSFFRREARAGEKATLTPRMWALSGSGSSTATSSSTPRRRGSRSSTWT